MTIEQIFGSIALIATVFVTIRLLFIVKKTLRLARLQRQRAYIVDIIKAIQQLPDNVKGKKEAEVAAWHLENKTVDAQDPAMVSDAAMEFVRVFYQLSESVSGIPKWDKGSVSKNHAIIADKLLGILYTGNLSIRLWTHAKVCGLVARFVFWLLSKQSPKSSEYFQTVRKIDPTSGHWTVNCH